MTPERLFYYNQDKYWNLFSDQGFAPMSFWQRFSRRFLRALGYSPTPRTTFEVDQALIKSLQEVASSEQRQTDEVAVDLLSFALAHRRAAAENLTRWHSLSKREQQVAALLCLDYTTRQIAARLVISPETVKTHIRNILRKFGVRRRTELRQALADWDFSAWEG